jgi:hypothetical protein
LAFRAEAVKREEIQHKRMSKYWDERFDPSDQFNLKAATLIQACFRSHHTRKKQAKIISAEIRKRRTQSQQRRVGHNTKPKNAKPRRATKRDLALAATKIQAAVRGRAERARFAALKQCAISNISRKIRLEHAKRSLLLTHDVPKAEEHLHQLREDFALVLAHELGIVQSQVRIMSIGSGPESNSVQFNSRPIQGASSSKIEFVILDADDKTAANADLLTAGNNPTDNETTLARTIVDSEEALKRFDEKVGHGDLLLAMVDVGHPKRYNEPGKRYCCLKPNKIAPLVSESEMIGYLAPQPRKHVYTVVPIGYAVVCGVGGLLLMAAVSSGMGAARTMAWLQAAVLSLAINILIVQPLQVVAIATFIQYAEGTENRVLMALASAASTSGQ